MNSLRINIENPHFLYGKRVVSETEVDFLVYDLQKTGCKMIKKVTRYCLTKMKNDQFSMTSIDILPTKCNVSPASPTNVEFHV